MASRTGSLTAPWSYSADSVSGRRTPVTGPHFHKFVPEIKWHSRAVVLNLWVRYQILTLQFITVAKLQL